MLGTCEDPLEVEVLDMLETRTGVHKSESPSSAYGSCEEAGKQRVQGSVGEAGGSRQRWCH